MKLEFPSGDTHFKQSDWDNYQLLAYHQLVEHTPHTDLALDCGAHAGIMTRRMSRDFDQVISFEPVHANLLRSNTQDLNNVQIIDKGVYYGEGIFPMQINRENSGDCVLGAGSDSITVIPIDSLNLSRVSAIKMDIQGSEYGALLGAAGTIQLSHPTLMIEIENWNPHARALQELLVNWDYVCVYQKNADRIYQWRGWQ